MIQSTEVEVEPIVKSVFGTMAKLDMELREPLGQEEAEGFVSIVQITGKWIGTVVMSISPSVVRASAAEMLDIAEDEVDETELEDVEARREILSDPEWIEAFREMWAHGKSGFNLDHMLRKLRLERQFLTRDLNDMVLFRVPVEGWIGQSLQFAYERYNAWVINEEIVEDEEEQRVFESLGRGIRDDGEFFIMLLRHYDRDLYWTYVNANKDPKVVRDLLFHPKLMPGFNDSGAHVTNMAYFDGNLRALHIGLEESESAFSHMVKRLTSEPAAFFGLEVGKIEVGARADLALLNPEALKDYDGEASVQLIDRELFGCEQLVNRSDGVVSGVYVNGERVWDGQEFSESHGTQKLGQALKVGS